jgi:hypothetical protein
MAKARAHVIGKGWHDIPLFVPVDGSAASASGEREHKASGTTVLIPRSVTLDDSSWPGVVGLSPEDKIVEGCLQASQLLCTQHNLVSVFHWQQRRVNVAPGACTGMQ